MNNDLKVVLYNDDTVVIIMGRDAGIFSPEVAVEIAQSLINVARDAKPDMDVEAVMKAYRDRLTNVSNEVH